MRPPRTLLAAFASIAVMAFSPAFAEETKTVEITVDLDAPAIEIYDSIRTQAWAACKPEKLGSFIVARMSVRRDCQRDMIAEVVQSLSYPELTALAQKDGIQADS